ncbi:MauE/DoxX family redox-associated membrane protein [Pseudoxanthomonas wuyuanensis]|uniref:Methylamine utilization protein MauE n=1 Tax=Pseudoxanthomonas wuyuanensis TaxID=1073196 RepID=A0A286DBF6_9GAMM|nr:glutaredoxin [Pseudoxanthomonas wuyuanensis]KAF1721847.1 glutaredoxin [Pseudoxanthomonas wuyuanensis]SOD55969.1 Glutaredoxin [Pseudoxanthomonas wuyuanensis]
MNATAGRHAALYRMVMDKHVCPWGLKSRYLLRRAGFTVDDHWLTTREETDAFKAQHRVETTPQVFIDGSRIGGYDDLRRYLGKPVRDPDAVSYRPVAAVFAMAALLALASSWASAGALLTLRTAEWFIAFAMCLLAMQKLQDVDSFATMFLGYDLLAQRWVPYAYLYPFGEALAGVLMLAQAGKAIAIPVALFIGSVGAVSVFYAVYVQGRQLRCACVGGNSRVPLGFVSLTENLMMVAMALWMLLK